MKERLNVIIARAGIASRRKADEIIAAGRVAVNGKIVSQLGSKADLEKDDIRVDGKPIRVEEKKYYILLNKPKGYVSSLKDTEGRPLVTDLIKGIKARLFPVGRLDINTEGLLLLTNDGRFALRITHPRYGCLKIYKAKVRGKPQEKTLKRMQKGIRIGKDICAAEEIKLLKSDNNSWLQISLKEGKKNEIRMMFSLVGHPVIKLKRIAISFLKSKNLPLGAYRHLTKVEVERLMSQSSKM
jgi:23S rRNA pseudouridine2605 synthase